MSAAVFRDILYGEIGIPTPLVPFLKIPEFVRLRGVRLSNVDSYQFKDFNGPTRWEHAIGVMHLALLCADARGLDEVQKAELALAGLLHDVATPPFAHTAEYVLTGFDHERETATLLSGKVSIDVFPDTSIFQSELPQFRSACAVAARHIGAISADEVAAMVVGDGERGFLISGTMDLDNIDNVTRACLFMGIEVDKKLPERLAVWLANQSASPLNLRESDNPDVRLWVSYREAMYSAFYSATAEEKGREAFLQHLFRRGVTEGIPRRRLVWNTDEGLLLSLASSEVTHPREQVRPAGATLRELVRRYRLLESPTHLVTLPITEGATLRVLQSPQAAGWLERELSTEWLEAIVAVNVRRHQDPQSQDGLFAPPLGEVLIYKVGSELELAMLPDWVAGELSGRPRGKRLVRDLQKLLGRKLQEWVKARPWLADDHLRQSEVKQVLDDVGDWSFRQSRNESFHVYPGTYVHAIPAALINALGLKGGHILDPFGGTGQTAIEAVKYGCRATSVDANSIAHLVASARLTYLDPEAISRLRSLTFGDLLSTTPAAEPEVTGLGRWYHPATLLQLRHMKGFIDTTQGLPEHVFLTAAFSAILTSVSGRRGKQHGYFADNTPLARGSVAPAYVDATANFLFRLGANVNQNERLYGFIERDGRDPQAELAEVDLRQANALEPAMLPGSVDAVITSPPYLCMADYTLGNRLSYHWLSGVNMAQDYERELGARRQRFKPHDALSSYYLGMSRFAERVADTLTPNGYVATVMGVPLAKAFAQEDVLANVDAAFARAGFVEFWSTWRDISWHRNHGYSRLATERIMVYARS